MARRGSKYGSFLGISGPLSDPGPYDAIAANALASHIQENQRLLAPAPVVTYGPSYQAHRQLRRAERDISALSRGFTTGKINLGAFSKAAEDLRKTYGENVLQQIPEWRNLQGTEGAYQNAINVKKLQTAVEKDIDPALLKWNPQEGDFTIDQTVVAARKIRREDEEVAQKPLMDWRNQQTSLINAEFHSLVTQANNEYRTLTEGKDVTPEDRARAERARNEQIRDARRWHRREYENLFGQNPAQQAEETKAQVLEQASGGSAVPQAPALSHPKLPPNANIAAAYESPEEFGAAKLKPNTYVIGGRYLFYVDANGNPRTVK